MNEAFIVHVEPLADEVAIILLAVCGLASDIRDLFHSLLTRAILRRFDLDFLKNWQGVSASIALVTGLGYRSSGDIRILGSVTTTLGKDGGNSSNSELGEHHYRYKRKLI